MTAAMGVKMRAVPTTIIRYPLTEIPTASLLGSDANLERRIWLADRIRAAASKATLGPCFVDVEMISLPEVPGPSVAAFIFDAPPGEEQNMSVATFVSGLLRRP